ncbi:MAG: 16S rRNA (cytosine(1402)-N(4))-methyltransferase RsmH [Chloroflexi bacterium]|jgi:16S rRNA (cytosine1402-N4)-methyltransferase|nr:16S rRNA (cytosine(1402)-N(4))-methyltransferase RsmH [Chloroflexota bacterium]MBT7082443.1 16S rRNA (cytosine(1402)-N(4))-methyltransferase RsmH [Chloroflexota bacterium]MBT7290026.1 16S rRNA (cytosine(1402)-N(4))-methyltransferase RsmH [Chloroflexota bacterium]
MTEHITVLLKEAVKALEVQAGGIYIDCTLGSGGHAESILKAGGQYIGIDADPKAVRKAETRLERYGGKTLINRNFSHLSSICSELEVTCADGVLFDLGMSSVQLEAEGRGFSFQRNEPLDMRFSPTQDVTAADIVNNYPESDLADVIYEYGEERRSRVIARRIVQNRPIRTSGHLAEVVQSAVGRKGKIHPATKTFQALRIAVNDELGSLKAGLDQAIELLCEDGRIAIISFHSLEDRIVKEKLRREAAACVCPKGAPICVCNHNPRLKLMPRKAIKPTEQEVLQNPRSRSARMRVAQKI